jgi:dipeptidase D
MSGNITNLEPQQVWKHFYALTQIPRPSGHEKAVIDHVSQFAKSIQLEYSLDTAGNILIRKRACKGKESHKTIVLQAHVDMVPQKNSEKQHDFTKDPIQTVRDGDWVRADKTTLGADNGIGVAAALAVLESENIQHGPLEVLLTVDEETGMDGAFGLSPEILQAEILLNLDSEDEGELFTGCAGGVDADITWVLDHQKMDNTLTFRIQLTGLKGGHSGIDIHLGRANANKVLLELIAALQEECEAGIVHYQGGDMRNAIPRESEVILWVPEKHKDSFKRKVNEYSKTASLKFRNTDPELVIELSEMRNDAEVISSATQKKIVNTLVNCANGPMAMSKFIPDVVQTSSNLSVVTISKNLAKAQLLIRSSDDGEKKQLAEQLKEQFQQSGAKVKLSGEYPGWQPNADSAVLARAKSTYKSLFGKEPLVKVIHAGLECGIIGGKYPAMDMISFGPTIRHPHSPDEKVHIGSVSKFWQFLVQLLENL